MAEKSDEEIINDLGLEASSDGKSQEEALDELSIKEEDGLEPFEIKDESNTSLSKNEQKEKTIENEDKDDEIDLNNDLENNQNDSESIDVQKKQPRIYKILTAVIAFLLLILSIGVIMYFSGFFDPEEPIKQAEKKIEKKAEPEIYFEEKNINKTKLNKKLQMLTKREIMNKEELEAEERKIKEEERKKKEAEQKALEEKQKKEAQKLAKIQEEKRLLAQQQEALKKEQEELLMLQENLKSEFEAEKKRFLEDLENQKTQLETSIPKDEPKEKIVTEEPAEETSFSQEEINEEENNKQFLSYINVATIKGDLYKSFLDKVLKIDKNISLCRDFKNRIEIYSGPFDSEAQRQKVLNNFLTKGIKEVYLIDFTQEEYEKRCKY